MIENDCANTTIPLLNVTNVILAKVIEYCKKHVEAPNSEDKVAEEELKFFNADIVNVDHGDLVRSYSGTYVIFYISHL
ncbi:SKP1-like protein 1B [Tanacetum coccineum]